MRNIHLKLAAVALLASTAFAGSAQAQIYGESSDTTLVDVGTSNVPFPPHSVGEPGIAVIGSGLTGFVDFDGLQTSAGIDPVTGVTTIDQGTSVPEDHSEIGVFHFAEVGTSQVYFGEWSQTGDVTAGDNTVYYVGDNLLATTPVAATATYAVNGLNDYGTNGLLSGTLTAAFDGSGGGTVDGSLTGHQTVSLNSVGISGAEFSTIYGGSASITPTGASAVSANASGAFFGTNAASIAGIVTASSNRALDTAFGGSQTSFVPD